MHSERYAHPEFGFLSPTPRLRRELRTAFLSLLFGIGIGAAAVIWLSRNNNGDDTQGTTWSEFGVGDQRTAEESLLGYDSPQAVGIEKRVNKENTGKPAGTTAEANSENPKPTLHQHARAIIRVVPMFLFPLASRVGRKCLQPLERL